LKVEVLYPQITQINLRNLWIKLRHIYLSKHPHNETGQLFAANTRAAVYFHAFKHNARN
jgi:hypothetical protein